ncbi:MgtE intracellular N-terminal domain protein [Leptospira interrogans serovar Grippotyphosa str. LT2186]|uniref:MgtE intracellular N-terminal domain protein n=1 Tax=Leptospira interrogans serovar Grippotyphosa str. LT2186 TaxID=1001599 RepID=M3GXI5_LEPIR|nr:MgtE intracellular N-terminal domain protein [Leptospira interrogans serovar Grippotyphosa str. LT2186]
MEERGVGHELFSEKANPSSQEWIEFFSEKIKAEQNAFLDLFLKQNHPADIAEVLEKLEEDEAFYVFKRCDSELQSSILVEFDEEFQADLISRFQMKEISPILENLETDELSSLISEFPKDKAEEILNSIDKEDSSQVRKQLTFREDSAGRLMNTVFASAVETDTVRKAIIKLRKIARDTDDIYHLYITDENNVLKGYVKLKNLFLAPLNTKVHRLMKTGFTSIHYDTDQEEIAKIFRKYDLVSVAVLDDLGRILGRITVDDILDIVHEEASEDILRLGGVSEEEKFIFLGSYFCKKKNGLAYDQFRNRLSCGFCCFLFWRNNRKIRLTCISYAYRRWNGWKCGNTINHIDRSKPSNRRSYNWKLEIRNSKGRSCRNSQWFYGRNYRGIDRLLSYRNFTLSMVMFMALQANLMIAAVIGTSIPLFLRALGIDPAIASSIFVTTFTDVFGFFCFLGLATLFIQIL